MSVEGGCSCGSVRYRLASEPLIVHCCHCRNCQRQTGSAFVVNVVIETDRIELLAREPHAVPVPRDDGSEQVIFRCPSCRVALFSRYGSEALRFVRAGTLDEPREIMPDVHIFTRSKVPWVTLPEGAPAFEGFYDPSAVWTDAMRARHEAARARRAS
ncbi:MAG TPA: GFA family protein [Gaiellaceae bacterium]|nr:GFA family protein [Gaiellaceae bacterium]